MKANISESELCLLAYLHEHARGFNESYLCTIDQIVKDLALTDEQLHSCSSYLADHGLVGVEKTFVGSLGNQHPILRGLWITGTGEDYMRQLEATPGVCRKLGAAAVRQLFPAIRDMAVSLLSELVRKPL